MRHLIIDSTKLNIIFDFEKLLDYSDFRRTDGGGFHLRLGKTKTAAGKELALWWFGFLCALALSMFLMAKAAERLPIGTVYPVWTGIGAVGAVVVGILFFQELPHSGESFSSRC